MEVKEIIEKIKKINSYIDENNKDKWDSLILFKSMKLSEEVGELYNEILWSLWFKRKDKITSLNNLEEEFADVIITTIVIAISMWVNIESTLEKKLEKIYSRFNLK